MSDLVTETTNNATNIVKTLKWPTAVLIMFAIWYFSPMVLGEFHGQIPAKIEEQQGTSRTTIQNTEQIGLGYGYNVVYSQDLVFLRLLIESIRNSPWASGLVLFALFIIIIACTPFTKALINNWGENNRNNRKCAMEENKHARSCEQQELPEKIKAEKVENDAKRAHEKEKKRTSK